MTNKTVRHIISIFLTSLAVICWTGVCIDLELKPLAQITGSLFIVAYITCRVHGLLNLWER